MGLLKIISTKSPLRLITTSKNANFFTKASRNVELDTINMSFASFESTQALASDVAPPLIVMHGLFGSKRNWNSLSKAFNQKTSPQRKIIAVDARNHGESPHCSTHSYPHLAEDIRTLLMQLNIKKAALLGHSMGGRAMMYFTLRYPEMVEKLIVGDVSPIGISSSSSSSMPSIFAAVQEVTLPRDVSISSARQTCDSQLSKTIDDKALRAFLLTNLAQKSDGSYVWRINIPALITNFKEHIVPFPDVSNLKFDGPVIFVAGATSDYIQKSHHPDILKIFPKAEFREIEGAGHWLHSDKPYDFLQICTEFLNKKDEQS